LVLSKKGKTNENALIYQLDRIQHTAQWYQTSNLDTLEVKAITRNLQKYYL